MQGPYFYLGKVPLSISSRVLHKYIYRDFGECCEGVPLDRPGSYVSISIKIYITIILACVVQVDAFLLWISKLLHLRCNGSRLLYNFVQVVLTNVV